MLRTTSKMRSQITVNRGRSNISPHGEIKLSQLSCRNMRLVYKPRFTRNAPNPPGPFQTHSLLCVRVGLVARSCLTLCDPMDCSQPGSSVHGIFQARILEWVAMPSFRGIFPTQDQTHVSCIASGFFAAEPLGKHPLLPIQFSIFSRLSSEQTGA